jgi:hypothetical protein
MARARVPTEKELAAILVGHGIIDFVTGGALSRAERNALWKVLKKVGPIALRGTAMAPIRAGGTVGMIAMRHPYLTGAAVIYVGYRERERIKQLLDQGYDIVEERLPTPSPEPRPGIPGVEQIITDGMAARPVSEFMGVPPSIPKGFDPMTMLRRKRRPSKFNKAVSAGMKVVKRAKRYGGKGKIKPAKSVFAMVTRIASAKKKKKKAPKSGIRRRIWNAMKGYK